MIPDIKTGPVLRWRIIPDEARGKRYPSLPLLHSHHFIGPPEINLVSGKRMCYNFGENAGMMELVDMRDLGSRAFRRWGSSPHARTRPPQVLLRRLNFYR